MWIPKPTITHLQRFQQLFQGNTEAYGTYDPATGKSWVIKSPLSPRQWKNHFEGKQPLGIFPVVGEQTAFGVVDIDQPRIEIAQAIITAAAAQGIPSYCERSKSKGYHVWFFFDPSAPAAWVRRYLHALLIQLKFSGLEVFPKQDFVTAQSPYGNYVNLPLFGGGVAQGRTVFLDPNHPSNPASNPYQYIMGIQTISPQQLKSCLEGGGADLPHPMHTSRSFDKKALLPCTRSMLNEGVSAYQRVACFRLAIHLKRAGYSHEEALALLLPWAEKNRPMPGKQIIREKEIRQQVKCAFEKTYCSLGCHDPAVSPYCEKKCPVFLSHRKQN